jgi:glutamate synthase (NADPH/NADH) small chain
VNFIWHAKPTAFLGTDTVEAVLSEPDLLTPAETVIIAIGQSKLLDTLQAALNIELHDGRVVVNPETAQTTNPRYFAGGDCVNGGREVVDAAAEGKRAAKGIIAWLT